MILPMENTAYFYRTAIFTRINNQVALADISQPGNTTPLDDWMGIVVSLADGQHTIQELVDYMGTQYQQAPDNLEETLHSVVDRLQEGKIIQLSEQAVDLPYYLASPIEELDIDKATDLIRKDGYSPH